MRPQPHIVDITQSAVDLIEGIGPAIKAELAAGAIDYVSDLLLYPPEYTHSLVASHSSLRQVESWRSMGLFLCAARMSPQWAEALVRAGIDDLQEYLSLDLARLQLVFDDAVEAHRIPGPPAVETIHDLTSNIASLHYGGRAQGFLRDSENRPIAGAEVRIGYHAARSNPKGFWRIDSLPPGDRALLTAFAEGFEDLEVSDLDVTADDWSTSAAVLRMTPGDSKARSRDEFVGDPIPELTCYRPRVVVEDVAGLREQDTFIVHALYRRSPHAKVVSIFRVFERGELVVRAYKVPLERFDGPVAKGECRSLRQGRLVAVTGASSGFFDYLRERKRQLAAPATSVDAGGLPLRERVLRQFVPGRNAG